MARSRNIKPGFFMNEELVELPFEYRLLFIGLWTLADRSGRLEDRPKKIKMGVFPADNVDTEKGLSELAERGFIKQYSVAGEDYIQIVAWDKHQNPHHREKESVIPSQGQASDNISLDEPCKGEKPKAGLDSERGQPEPSRADSLIPDSLIPDKKQLSNSKESDPCPHEKIIAIYNRVLGGQLKRVIPKLFSDSDRVTLRARWNQDGAHQNLEFWEAFFTTLKNYPFYLGQVEPGAGRDKPWRADFRWLIKQKNFNSVVEKFIDDGYWGGGE